MFWLILCNPTPPLPPEKYFLWLYWVVKIGNKGSKRIETCDNCQIGHSQSKFQASVKKEKEKEKNCETGSKLVSNEDIFGNIFNMKVK